MEGSAVGQRMSEFGKRLPRSAQWENGIDPYGTNH
jgi:hypothetical protein